MNYYEELGIRPDADEEEIRKAHRRLVKLMHPDQHRDQGMKQLAETIAVENTPHARGLFSKVKDIFS